MRLYLGAKTRVCAGGARAARVEALADGRQQGRVGTPAGHEGSARARGVGRPGVAAQGGEGAVVAPERGVSPVGAPEGRVLAVVAPGAEEGAAVGRAPRRTTTTIIHAHAGQV